MSSVTQYGFDWGPMRVTRLFMHKIREREVRFLAVETDHHTLEVSVSRTGRSVRVWRDGKELK